MTFASSVIDVALSRDGTRLAYSEFEGSTPHLMLRMLDQLEGTSIPGASYAGGKAFSPDGQWIAYVGYSRATQEDSGDRRDAD
jgi:Tol biopolymer transport system component